MFLTLRKTSFCSILNYCLIIPMALAHPELSSINTVGCLEPCYVKLLQKQGCPSRWRMKLEAQQAIVSAHKFSCCGPLIWMKSIVNITSHWHICGKKTLSPLISTEEASILWASIAHTQVYNKDRIKEVEERWIYPDLMASKLPARNWLEAQTCLDRHITWWACSSLRVI